ncbi:MAG: pseudaminic acid synthase [Actinobacteria bacterium]|nr:pseudaminic acid synthase [Actinomycetota bacterium]
MTSVLRKSGKLGPAFIAEISGNHNGSLNRALDIVRAMADSGADAIKIQTYTADTMTLPVDTPAFRISGEHELWGSRNLYELYEEAHTPWAWHEPIFSLAQDLGMSAFSTPFDETAVEFLETLDVPVFKIASLEIVDLPLIELVASKGKPVIISVGTATIGEVAEAVSAAKKAGCTDLTLLACTSSYPARPQDANLRRMQAMKDMFGVKVGLSDHTMGSGVAVAAVALGAEILEKHVTLRRQDGGVDSAFSLEPAEVRNLIENCDDAFVALGRADAWVTEAESESLRLRPSLYVTRQVSAGDVVSNENVRSVRPGGGLEPKYLDAVMGQKFLEDCPIGTPVSWHLISAAGSNN